MAHAFASPHELRRIKITPAEALLEEVNRTNNVIRWLDSKIFSAFTDGEYQAGTRIEDAIDLWHHERAHLLRACTAANTARAVEMIEDQQNHIGAQVIADFYALIDHLQLSPDDELKAREYFKGRMMAIEGDIITEIE